MTFSHGHIKLFSFLLIENLIWQIKNCTIMNKPDSGDSSGIR